MRACLTMLPRLEAEESLLAAARVAMGSGTYEKHSRNQVHRAWTTQARPPRRVRWRRRRKPTPA